MENNPNCQREYYDCIVIGRPEHGAQGFLENKLCVPLVTGENKKSGTIMGWLFWTGATFSCF